jgi:hypothetical protein
MIEAAIIRMEGVIIHMFGLFWTKSRTSWLSYALPKWYETLGLKLLKKLRHFTKMLHELVLLRLTFFLLSTRRFTVLLSIAFSAFFWATEVVNI